MNKLEKITILDIFVKKSKKSDLNQKNRFKSKKSDFFDFFKKIMILIHPGNLTQLHEGASIFPAQRAF